MSDAQGNHIGPFTCECGRWKIIARCDVCGFGYISVNRKNYPNGIKCLKDDGGTVWLTDEYAHLAALREGH